MDNALLEAISEMVHDAWAAEKIRQGFAGHVRTISTNGVGCCTNELHHEDMKPYADLSETTKDYDRATVRAVFGAIEAAGCVVLKRADLSTVQNAVGLLNSMVLCGESHSDTSREAVRMAREVSTNERAAGVVSA